MEGYLKRYLMAGEGAEVINLKSQRVAVYPSPQNSEAQQALEHRGSFITPEGYDVIDPPQAEAYLVDEGHNPDLPQPRGELDMITGYHIALRMQTLKRAALHENGEFQTNADHSYALGHMAVRIALSERPDLDAGKVSIMSGIHDEKETFGDDTPVFNKEMLATKPYREKAGHVLLITDLEDNPRLVALHEEMEEGKSPEARFVKGMDKVEALMFTLHTRAMLQRSRGEDDFNELVEVMLAKTSVDPTAFKYAGLILKEIGNKWIGWECKPFEGNPDEIVDDVTRQIAENQLTEEPAQKAIPVPRLFSGLVEIVEQPDLPVEVALERGATSLDSYRNRKNPPEKPLPPAGSGKVAVGAAA